MLRDEQRMQAEKLKDASLKDKINYYWYYYKVHTIIVLLAIPFIIWVALTIIHSDMDALQIIITDQMGDTLDVEYIEAVYKSHTADPIATNFDTSLELAFQDVTEANVLDHEKLLALYQSKTLDVFISAESVFKKYGPEGMFAPLDTLLPEDLLKKLDAEGRILYITLTDYSENGDEAERPEGSTAVPAGIYINDTKLAADSGMNIYDACIGIAYNSSRTSEALKFLELYLTESQGDKQ